MSTGTQSPTPKKTTPSLPSQCTPKREEQPNTLKPSTESHQTQGLLPTDPQPPVDFTKDPRKRTEKSNKVNKATQSPKKSPSKANNRDKTVKVVKLPQPDGSTILLQTKSQPQQTPEQTLESKPIPPPTEELETREKEVELRKELSRKRLEEWKTEDPVPLETPEIHDHQPTKVDIKLFQGENKPVPHETFACFAVGDFPPIKRTVTVAFHDTKVLGQMERGMPLIDKDTYKEMYSQLKIENPGIPVPGHPDYYLVLKVKHGVCGDKVIRVSRPIIIQCIVNNTLPLQLPLQIS